MRKRKVVESEPAPSGSAGTGFGVAGLTEGLKIGEVMRAALIGRDEMMDFVGRSIFTGLQTFLTKRVLRDIQVTNLTPTRTVDFVVVGRANVFVILPPGDGLMLRTVAVEGDFGTAGVGTGVRDF
jgi:hypothetical protein